MILSATTDKIEVVLGGAVTTNQLRCVSNWTDRTATTFTKDRTVINTNNTTDVTVVGSPAASTQRTMTYLSVYNHDTVPQTVTVKYDANATEYILAKVTLGVQERLEYTPGTGFRVLSDNGSIKEIPSSIGVIQRNMLTGDVTNNNGTANTIADVTGLSFNVKSGSRYYFRFFIQYTAAVTTTGSRWSINGPATTSLIYNSQYSLGATTITTNEGLTAYNTPAACNTDSAATGGNIAMIEGIIVPSADGTVIARFASEVSSSAIVAKAGSFVEFQQLS